MHNCFCNPKILFKLTQYVGSLSYYFDCCQYRITLDDQCHLVLGVGCQGQQRRPLQSPTSDIWESRE